MAKEDWQRELLHDIAGHEELYDVLLRHLEAAYKRGVMAERSRAGYRQPKDHG
ncbi:hypothetical protein [Streptomyces halobius]|uniref:Uncharacterized protein n=1 Tax=Streptomyces halobius TaxID=2879846 RepID=A0ABY4M1H3_9ACTN|nr:hypothetical protein [Streptomyces halobius]UQA91609.1 hypothetical protein K9S39_06830 [Streptomyces halobius]